MTYAHMVTLPDEQCLCDDCFGRHAYLSIADELSGDPDFLQDADPAYVEAARAFALGLGLPYPPTADVDLAFDEVRNRERNPR